MPRMNLRPFASALAGPSMSKTASPTSFAPFVPSLHRGPSSTLSTGFGSAPAVRPGPFILSIRSIHFSASRPSLLLSNASTSSPILSHLRTQTPSPLAINPTNPRGVRHVTYGMEYQPSQRKRKRSYGFLARKRGGKKGEDILKRRRALGRRFLSH